MKRWIRAALLLVLLLTGLTGCGEKQTKEIDLQTFFDEVSEKYELVGMVPLEGDMLAAFYPGLEELDTVQRVAYSPMISASVSEYVFLQCADKATVQAASALLQKRIDDQAAGGAWYPESMAAWSWAKVIIKENYVLMIAADGFTEKIAADFNELF